ncbi:MAG: FtsL-like putative cell division protein [Alloprevotella sp.]|nr:FtsL-like putative cell division protein [Alloprevotella sp.]
MNTDDKNKTHTEPELEIVVPADDTLTEETDSTKDETNAPTDEPQPEAKPKKKAKINDETAIKQHEEQAKKIFKKLTDIDDEGETTGDISIKTILGGDFFTRKRFKRQLGLIVLLCVLAIIYVSNRYAYQREEIRRDQLARELNDRKFKALTIAGELTEYSMRSHIEENLTDSTLKTSTQASYFIQMD